MPSLLAAKARPATLAAAARAFLPETCDLSAIEAVARDLVEEAAHVPRDRQQKLALFLDLLAQPLFVRTLGVRARPLSELSRDEAERALSRLARHPVPLLRTALQMLRRAVCFVTYGGSNGAALWRAMGYPGPRSDRTSSATAALTVVSAERAPDEADVVVIGSGAGGAVAAASLAGAGARVVVLEEGEHLPPARVDQRELEGFRRLFLERGAASTDDLAITLLAGRAVGGGTVVNWNASLRLDAHVAAEWDRESGLDGLSASLAPHYDAVARRLELAHTPDNGNNAALRAGCVRLGWEVQDIARNARGCGEGCGYCTFGCAYGNKRDMTRTYLLDATASGATIVEGADVDHVALSRGRPSHVLGVSFRTRSGALRFLRAPRVFVAAGALRTPRVLARSGVRSPLLGRNLRLHPTTPILGVFDRPIEPWHGAPMTAVCKRFARMNDGFGFVLEVAPSHPGLASVAIPWTDARTHARDVAALARTAVAIAITRDRDGGAVGSEDVPRVRYRLSPFDARHVLEGIAAGARALLAAGAREVYTTHVPPLRLARERASERALSAFRAEVLRRGVAPGRLALFSAHQMGTARMSARARDGVVDERGTVHGTRGLVVCDGSVFPAASGVNPMLTIMAMAHRIATLHGGAS